METIVIFANSVKHGQHCVAGKSLATGQWIRPVADANGKELDHEQAKYRNPYGRYLVKPLQKIQMELGANVPLRQKGTEGLTFNPSEVALVPQTPRIEAIALEVFDGEAKPI